MGAVPKIGQHLSKWMWEVLFDYGVVNSERPSGTYETLALGEWMPRLR